VTYKAKPKRERINPIMFFQKGKKRKRRRFSFQLNMLKIGDKMNDASKLQPD
jgi:hypothetical protein